jgi:hypothetical protein
MKNRFVLPCLAVLGAGIALSSCGKSSQPLAPEAHASPLDVFSQPDSAPPPHPHPSPPPHTNTVTVLFDSADTTLAGTSGASHWLLGNDGPKVFTAQWSLTVSDSLWPGFPIQGSIALDRRSGTPLTIQVPVPADAPEGTYDLMISVSTPDPNTFALASGFLRVVRNSGTSAP